MTLSTTTAKLTEIQIRTTFPFPFTCYSHSSLHLFYHSSKPFLLLKTFSSLHTRRNTYPWDLDDHPHTQNPNAPKPKPAADSWLNKWTPPTPKPNPPTSRHNSTRPKDRAEIRHPDDKREEGGSARPSAIERIVLRLRNLRHGSADNEEEDDEKEGEEREAMLVTGEEKLGDLLRRDWVRPDKMLVEEVEEEDEEEALLPWERVVGREQQEGGEAEGDAKKKMAKAPTLAELTIEDSELRRLRRLGITIRERVSVPKAGITGAVLEKIHEQWRKSELVRLKFHESLVHDMRTAHEIVERRSGGLVIWRSGSVMVVFRGSNYEGPSQISKLMDREDDSFFVPDVSNAGKPMYNIVNGSNSILEKTKMPTSVCAETESMTEEQAEYNSLLDGLGPRFEDWWGTRLLPVDADLLPQTIPGFKTPFRLLPIGMRPRLTNAELTNFRKIAKSLPCHFALGRNRKHQGLAAAIIKLWEKSLIVKIAVKRGIQNTNNKLMAEEIKNLTGGVLLLRNKYFIVIYRGKDFLPTSVASALVERQEMTKQIQDVEEQVRNGTVEASLMVEGGPAQAGTLAEFYEAQARWGRETSNEEREKMIEEASRTGRARAVKRMEHKLNIAQTKLHRAEKLLAKLEASMVPVGPSDDQETITEEERSMFRRVGLRMKPYLPVGIRGVFAGVIENMHLHWKHRELVKLISKQKSLAFVEETARLLEYESGGILVAIERVPKGHAIIYYRGKNYQRPISLRPRNLLTKAKALKRSVAMQRHEALSQHISEVEKAIEHMRNEIDDGKDVQAEDHDIFDDISDFSQSEDEASLIGSNADEDPLDWEDEVSESLSS
ncbi:CRM-domain containing factor CFM3, chloroplastic/mitochondrial [Rhododendron vialii]|uniref:CRM-domain containing factor CFM3, chloroplastic/mitochondrial n=1 Tax=Rhododendron vialii TaxID=182163 RepID=UPI00266035B0|nr:CRM-domain containing factor CFM3, chloroplastic/mitochondrial [Rhododendron vialii]